MRGRRFGPQDHGVATVLGAILVVGLLAISAVTVQVTFVPIWEKNREYTHMMEVQAQLAAIRAEIDRQVDSPSGLVVSHPLTLGVASSGAFQNRRLGDNLQLVSTGQTAQVTAPRLTVQMSNGQFTGGANESWSSVTTTGITVQDVSTVHNFRLRLPSVSRDNDSQSLTITVTDANGFAGDFKVSVANVAGNDYNVNRITRNRDGVILYSQPDNFANNQVVSPYWVNLLDTEFRFNSVIAGATAPLRIDLTKPADPNGLGGDFTISFVQQTGGVFVGGGGQVFQPYASPAFTGGTFSYTANNVRLPSQTYVLENGALILNQPDGSAFRVEPGLSVAALSSLTGSSSTVLSLPRPANLAVDDILVAQLTLRTGMATTITASGWNSIRRDADSGNAITQALYWRKATATEPSLYAFTFSQSVKAAGGILAFGGIDFTNPIDVSAGSVGSGTAAVAPSLTPTASNEVLLGFFGTAASTSFAPPAGMSEQWDVATTGSSPVTASGATQILASSDPTGTRTANSVTGGTNIGQLVALRTLAPAFRAAQAGPSQGTSTTYAINKPSGVVQNDVMIASLAVAGGSGTTITAPSGWTLVRRDDSGTAISVATYTKVAGGSEPSSYMWTLGASVKAAGGIAAYQRVDAVTAVDVHSGQPNAASTSITAPGVTPTIGNDFLVGVFGTQTASGAGSFFTPAAGMAERFEVKSSTGGTQASLTMDDQFLSGTAATGDKVATAGSSAVNVGQLVALRSPVHLRGSGIASSEVAAALGVSISIPTLNVSPTSLQTDQTVVVQTSATPGTSITGTASQVTFTVGTLYPKTWGSLLRQRLSSITGLSEGTHYTVDDSTTANQVAVTILGPNTGGGVEDIFLTLQQVQINLAIRA